MFLNTRCISSPFVRLHYKTAAIAAVLFTKRLFDYREEDKDTVVSLVANPTFPAKSVDVAPSVITVS